MYQEMKVFPKNIETFLTEDLKPDFNPPLLQYFVAKYAFVLRGVT